jgi:RHS repeat-associated protein
VRYRAFGATRFTSGVTPTSYRYTGQREEAGLGLYYYGARWYDPALGHFIQPDTVIPNPGNVLDYHRYSYTRFTPLKYTDPCGHCVVTTASSLAFDTFCWTTVVAAIQLSNHLALWSNWRQAVTARINCLCALLISATNSRTEPTMYSKGDHAQNKIVASSVLANRRGPDCPHDVR